MKNLHPVIQRMICETAKMYAITEVDSYLHIDNFMSINKRKFKPNARITFAERVIAEADDAEDLEQYQGLERTWGQAFSDFTKGGFAGLKRGKADILRNYNIAMQNLGQMINAMNNHPESSSVQVLDSLKSALGNIIKTLDEKKPIITKINSQIQTIAQEKGEGKSPRQYHAIDLSDMQHINLDKMDIYNYLITSQEFLYSIKQFAFDLRKEAHSLKSKNIDPKDIVSFYENYVSKFYNRKRAEYKNAKITPDLILNYLKASNRIKEAAEIGAKITKPTGTAPATGTNLMAKEHYELYLSGIITEAQYNKFKKRK